MAAKKDEPMMNRQERLDFLRAKGPLSSLEQMQLERLKAKKDRDEAEERMMAYLMDKSPRTEDEQRELMEMESGPFTVEQWMYMTDYIERAIQHRHSHRGRVPQFP